MTTTPADTTHEDADSADTPSTDTPSDTTPSGTAPSGTAPSDTTPSGTAPRRLAGVDALRGAVLALMVLTPVTGGPGATYPHLGHAAWDGFTVSDAILPLFLVTSGASLALLLRGPLTTATALRLVRRTIALLVLGVLYNAVGQPLDLHELRLTGVLQMIGIAGAVAAGVVLAARWRAADPHGLRALAPVAAAAVALPVAHGLLLARPRDCPAALERCSPLFAWDLRLLGASHLYADGTAGHDPEGLAASVAAAALVLCGYLAMAVLLGRGIRWRTLLVVAVAGVGLVLVGVLADGVQPINKRLHTPAFSAVAGGLGVLGLAAALALWDLGRGRRGLRAARVATAHPLVTLGRNALVVFLAERLLLVAAAQTTVGGPDGPRSLQDALVGGLLPVEAPRVHLAYTALLLAVVLAITYGMRALRWRVAL